MFHVVTNAPNEYGGGISIFERRLEIHPLLENAKKTKVKALKDICRMRWKSDKLDSVDDKFFYVMYHCACELNHCPPNEPLANFQERDLITPLQCTEEELLIYSLNNIAFRCALSRFLSKISGPIRNTSVFGLRTIASVI
jgi:hypothetical protein